MLEGNDTRGGAFALFLPPHPGAFRQLVCPHPGEFAHFLKKNANSWGLARGGMGTAGIDWCITSGITITRAIYTFGWREALWELLVSILLKNKTKECSLGSNPAC